MNELLILKKESLNMRGINKELARSKQLIENENYTNYLYVQALYRKAFEKYLTLKINLGEYDKEINESKLDFGVMPEDRKTDFHKVSYLDLKYIYVRNWFFVEKLKKEYISIFFERLNSKNYEIDEQLLKIVEETYKDVINDNFKHRKYKDETTTCYGTEIPSNIVNSKALVLVIQYGKNTKSYKDEEFLINKLEKQKYLEEISNRIAESVMKSLETKVKVIIRTFVGE